MNPHPNLSDSSSFPEVRGTGLRPGSHVTWKSTPGRALFGACGHLGSIRTSLRICVPVHAADATEAAHADRTLAAFQGAFLPVEQRLIRIQESGRRIPTAR